jgi:hypothetical protein
VDSYRRYYCDHRGNVFYADKIEALSEEEAVRASMDELERIKDVASIEIWLIGRRLKIIRR